MRAAFGLVLALAMLGAPATLLAQDAGPDASMALQAKDEPGQKARLGARTIASTISASVAPTER